MSLVGAGRGWPAGGDQDFSRDASLRISKDNVVGTTSTDPNLNNRNYTVIITQDQDLPAGPPRIVVGAVPQSIQIAQNVEWKAPWGAGLAGDGAVGDFLAATRGNRLVAQVATMQVWQGSGNDFEFTVQFELRAWSDPVRDVLDPLRTLLRMSLPSKTESGFLKSPGPILGADGVDAVSGHLTSVVSDVLSAGLRGYTGVSSQTSDGSSSILNSVAGGAKAAYEAAKNSKIADKNTIENYLKNKISIQIGRWFFMKNVVVTQVQHDIQTQTPDRRSGIIQSASVTVGFKPMFSITAEDVDSMLRSGGVA